MWIVGSTLPAASGENSLAIPWFQPTTILLDEPDAHLHVNLQREILDYFKKKSAERGIQFLIAFLHRDVDNVPREPLSAALARP